MARARRQPGISVALPVTGGRIAPGESGQLDIAALLESAIRCILRQSHHDLDIMVILNGADPHLHAIVRTLAFRDSRIRMLELPKANLAAALNLGLEQARFDLVARMDADDLCDPERLKKQSAFMVRRPGIAALGCAWELIDPDGRPITVVRPPTDTMDLRWRLLLGNTLAHGSMMLRRRLVLDAGGYDTACTRAQDYELWLRLIARGHAIACLPDVLYRHRTRHPTDPARSTGEQAEIAVPLMLEAWRQLPPLGERDTRSLERALIGAMSREVDEDGSASAIEKLLAKGPTKESLLAWLWMHWQQPPMHRSALETCRLSRLREVGASLRKSGIRAIHLWGAGDHTRWILEHRDALGLEILDLIDDAAAARGAPKERFGLKLRAPGTLKKGECALISSDWFEDQIWARAEPHRRRGVRVWRLYG